MTRKVEVLRPGDWHLHPRDGAVLWAVAKHIRPHHYCLPVLKRERHRPAFRRAATSGSPRFFLGTDPAPHLTGMKETACGCVACSTAPVALPCLAQVFEEEDALDQLEAFVSKNGGGFCRMPVNDDTMTPSRGDAPLEFPDKVETEDGPVTVFNSGGDIFWRVDGYANG